MPSKKLFLLDAMALIYRAHFAFSKNPRINSKNINTGAVLGFTNTLLEVLNKEKPTHIGVAFDTAAPTFRHEAFEAYKAQRQAQPEDIAIAIPIIKEMCRGFRIPVLELDGFEADDIIGTLAKKASQADFEVFMMTPDKDYGQLVEDHIFLYKPSFMGNDIEIWGVNEVLARWEIKRVDQVTDMLGLQGDASDNIPGIPGIGPKTAAKLLAEYDTVENLVANADKLKGKQKDTVISFGQQGILSKQLATIDVNVPVPFDEEALLCKSPDPAILKPLFDELEFRAIKKKIFGDDVPATTAPARTNAKDTANQLDIFGAAPAQPQPSPAEEPDFEAVKEAAARNNINTVVHEYQLIDTPELRKSLVHFLGLQEEICFDTETTGLDPFEAELVGMSFSYLAREAYYVPVPANQQEAQTIIEEFRPIFENENISKIGQNIKYDMIVLQSYNVTLKGTLFDTMLAHYLIEPDMRHNMDVLSEVYLHYTPVSIESLIGKRGKGQLSFRDVELEKAKEYAAEDADVTLQLKSAFSPVLKSQELEKLFYEVEMPLVPVLADMERTGVQIDTAALKIYSKDLEKDLELLEKEIHELAGQKFNIGSPKQLGEILFQKLKLDSKAKQTKTGQYATGEEVLSKLAPEHPIASKILEHRQLQKLKSTYIDALPELISPKDGRIHTSYNQAVAATGRLSSTNPNLQNIPIRTEKGREIRKAFVPRSDEFVILSADYSQIELRIMAAFSKDPAMIEAFQQGRDIHTTTASKIFKVPLDQVDSDMRRKAKTANFGIIYGVSAFGLAERLNISRKEAGEIITAYFDEFPAVKQYMDNIINFAREHEYVETILKRRRYLRDINSRNQTLKGYSERNAINAPIQGSAADMIKIAMINIHRWMKQENLRSHLILQVHDELVFEAHKEEIELLSTKITELMANALPLEVPMEIGIGTGINWLEAH